MRIAIDWKERRRELAIFCAVGTFLTVIAPYNATRNLPFWAAFLYWTGLVILGSMTAEITLGVLRKYRPGLPRWALLLTVSLTTASAVSLTLYVLEWLVFGQIMPVSYMPRLFGLVWVIAAAMTGIGYLMERAALAPPPEPVEGANPAETFLSRLPLKYRKADLYAVSSEDHYLRVHTSLGEELILMRLADAVRELAGADGLQVHRSWWIARTGVTDIRKHGSRLSLVLVSGKEAPVSRTYLADVKAAGLAG